MLIIMIFLVAIAIVSLVVFSVFCKNAKKTLSDQNLDSWERKTALRTYEASRKLRVIIPVVALLILAVSFTTAGIKIIDSTEIGVVRVFGRVDREIYGGLNFINPISDSTVKYDLTTHMQTADFATYTKDAQPVTASVDYQYALRKGEVMDVAKEFGSYEVMESKLNAVVEEKVKAVFARYGGMSLLEHRANLSDEVFLAIKELENIYHVDFINAVVNNIDFSDAFEASVEAKMTAEQEALRAEQEKKKAIVQAEQQRETAQIEAEAAIAKAKGEAEAMSIVREALRDMPEEYIEQLWIDKWDGKLPTMMTGDNTGILLNPTID